MLYISCILKIYLMNNVLMCYLVQSANNFMIFASTSSGIQVCNFVFRVPVWLCHQINAGLIKKVWRYSLFFHSLQKLEKKTILFKCSINSAVNPSSPGLYLREDFTTNSISSLIIDLFRFSFFFFFIIMSWYTVCTKNLFFLLG